jgi:protein-S-isoprenylcysteine O-methyltransferase Ste14
MADDADNGLGRRVFLSTARFVGFLGVLILAAGGSLHYWQGWLFWINFSLCTAAVGYYFYKHDPALVRRRLKAGPAAEKEPSQKRIQLFAVIFICALFIVSAIDYRFGWSNMPWPDVLLGNVLVVVGYVVMFYVFRANSFAAATVQVDPDQKVISTGPYAWVRHPMYFGALIMFAGVPLALGSWWGLLIFPLLIGVLAVRLLDEENYLVRNLKGYDDYRQKVRSRLLPGVW